MSTIVRLQRERGQAFGAGHLIDILRGAGTDRIRQQRHDELATYGIGADLGDQDWRGVVRQLLAGGLLVAQGEYGTLALGEGAAEVLRGERPVPLRRDVLRSSGRSRQRRTAPEQLTDPADREVFDALRAWRTETAKEQGVPAYVVFADATLRALATARPATLDDLDGITGIGAKKRETYGEAVIAVLGQHA
jgi:ATP-dependent DNA helicase RecQ